MSAEDLVFCDYQLAYLVYGIPKAHKSISCPGFILALFNTSHVRKSSCLPDLVPSDRLGHVHLQKCLRCPFRVSFGIFRNVLAEISLVELSEEEPEHLSSFSYKGQR